MSLQAQLIPSNGLKMNSPTVSNGAKNYVKPQIIVCQHVL